MVLKHWWTRIQFKKLQTIKTRRRRSNKKKWRNPYCVNSCVQYVLQTKSLLQLRPCNKIKTFWLFLWFPLCFAHACVNASFDRYFAFYSSIHSCLCCCFVGAKKSVSKKKQFARQLHLFSWNRSPFPFSYPLTHARSPFAAPLNLCFEFLHSTFSCDKSHYDDSVQNSKKISQEKPQKTKYYK